MHHRLLHDNSHVYIEKSEALGAQVLVFDSRTTLQSAVTYLEPKSALALSTVDCIFVTALKHKVNMVLRNSY